MQFIMTKRKFEL